MALNYIDRMPQIFLIQRKIFVLTIFSFMPFAFLCSLLPFTISLDSTNVKIVWIKITTFFKRCVSIIL